MHQDNDSNTMARNEEKFSLEDGLLIKEITVAYKRYRDICDNTELISFASNGIQIADLDGIMKISNDIKIIRRFGCDNKFEARVTVDGILFYAIFNEC